MKRWALGNFLSFLLALVITMTTVMTLSMIPRRKRIQQRQWLRWNRRRKPDVLRPKCLHRCLKESFHRRCCAWWDLS